MMKIVIEKKDLSTITSQVYRAASSKNTIPVLSGLMIRAEENRLTMTATDMEIGIKASTPHVDVVESGQVLVNAHYFADFIKVLPDTKIILEYDPSRAKLKVSYGKSSGFLNTYREQEYPDLPLQNTEQIIALPQKTIKDALRKTSFAAAQSHFRQVFTGVLFDFDGDDKTLKVVASDTHRLAYFKYQITGDEIKQTSFIIPSRTVNELSRWLEETDDLIGIALSPNNVVFYKENFTLISRLIEGQYPNYEQVIPSAAKTQIMVDSHLFANILERAKVMPTDDKLKIPNVLINIRDNEAVLNSYSEMMGEIEEIIDDIQISGDKDFKISFNTNYFLDVVKLLASESDEIFINLNGSLGSAVINSNKQDYLYVLVPLRTSS